MVVSTRRDDALAALRDWSRPDRRDELLAAAWVAGETRITALAEAARTSRPTVYRALRNQGINPDDRPQEDPMTTTAPIALDGMTGTDFDEVTQAVHRWMDQHPDATEEERKAAIGRTRPVFMAVLRYNTLREDLSNEAAARRERDRALHLVEKRWEELSTAAHWLAAHHAYIVAVDEARTALERWSDAALSAADNGKWTDLDAAEVYRTRILAAGHPEADAPNSEAVGREAEELRTTLEQTHERRKELAAETLRLT